MADLKPEAIEPVPAATPIANDETVNKNGGDTSAPADTLEESAKAANGDKPEEVKASENGDKKEDAKPSENGDNNRSPQLRRDRGGRGGFNQKRDNGYKGRTEYPSRRNNKFDPSAQGVTDDPTKIRSQVEFYFGDSNLPTDKFLWELTDGQENKPVPVATVHKFKRMQIFQPYSAVVAALKDSSFLVISGEEGNETITRKNAYDPSAKDHRMPRTVYAKGFGEEKPTSQLDIEAFFAQFGTTRAVRLRRTMDGQDSGLFKESVFVEFEDEETAKRFLELDPKPQFEGKDLKIMSKADYVEEKTQLIKDGKMEPNESKPYKFDGNKARGRGGNRGGRDRGGRGRGGRDGGRDRDPNDWKKRREDDQKSGFSDNRGGRGGRGRGRGDNSRGDRNSERESKGETTKAAVDVAALAVAEEDSKKRGREDNEGDASEVPAKKQDTKETVETS